MNAPCPCRTVWAVSVLVALVSLGLAVGGEVARWESRAELLRMQLAASEAMLDAARIREAALGGADHVRLLTAVAVKRAEEDADKIHERGIALGAIPPPDPVPNKRARRSLRSDNRSELISPNAHSGR